MAAAVAAEVNILNPDYVLACGGAPDMPGFPREPLEARIRAHARKPCPERSLSLRFPDDAPEKSVIGAAICAMSRQARQLSPGGRGRKGRRKTPSE